MTQGVLNQIDVAVLAGGLGTRVSHVLGTTPKLLAPVQGRPYIEHFLGWIGGFGARRVVFCLGHLADVVVQYLRDHPPALSVEVVIEPEPMGTAGALRHARSALRSDPVLVCNGDTFVDADLAPLVQRHQADPAAATLLCGEVADTSRFGRITLDGQGRIASFAEKGGGGPGLINCGLYLMSAPLLDRIAEGQARSLERDVLAQCPPGSLGCHAGRFDFLDIGTPESLSSAATHRLPGSA
ncbi:sugar phosphate nucleotidyltransferase [Ferrovibrio sp.]|uniref:sugar phosphate nucleotidyltransferase n=1 Tax=Ferrovibrio sp. TaxID=1917215 RepID=UPI003D14054A